jgi:hypothetical protein
VEGGKPGATYCGRDNTVLYTCTQPTPHHQGQRLQLTDRDHRREDAADLPLLDVEASPVDAVSLVSAPLGTRCSSVVRYEHKSGTSFGRVMLFLEINVDEETGPRSAAFIRNMHMHASTQGRLVAVLTESGHAIITALEICELMGTTTWEGTD